MMSLFTHFHVIPNLNVSKRVTPSFMLVMSVVLLCFMMHHNALNFNVCIFVLHKSDLIAIAEWNVQWDFQ